MCAASDVAGQYLIACCKRRILVYGSMLADVRYTVQKEVLCRLILIIGRAIYTVQ
jgi:hypothetical protein